MKDYKQNLHTHTTYCDGKDTPEQVVLKAIEKGFNSIGFSGHAPNNYSGFSYKRTIPEYIEEINRLKRKYYGVLDIYCGLEYVAFDRSAEYVQNMIEREFGGKGIEFAKEYYRQFAKLRDYGKFDIVAHFDIIAKNVELANIFDVESKEYKDAALECLTALRENFDIFEINTGAISRGHRTSPYPQKFILEEMKRLNCQIVITSDCHDANYLDCAFADAKEFAKSCGFREQVAFIRGKFEQIPL